MDTTDPKCKHSSTIPWVFEKAVDMPRGMTNRLILCRQCGVTFAQETQEYLDYMKAAALRKREATNE